MTTPETTIAIADGAQGARPNKAGKKPNAGATAGAFTAELASLTGKTKKAKVGHTTEFPPNTHATGHDPADKKPSVEAGKPKRNSAVAQTEGKPKSHKDSDTDADDLIAAAAAHGDRGKIGDALAAIAGTPNKGGDGQTSTRPHPEPKIPAASTIPEPGKAAKPEGQLLVDAPSANQKAAALKSLPKDQKHHAKFDEMIAQHQSNTQPQSSQPNAAQVQAAAQQHQQQQQAQSHAQSLRAEATQAAAASDNSSAQANALLRAPESSSSSAGFEAHLDAPTAARAVEHVAWTMARKSETGERNFEIRMDPPELGRIDVKMQVSHDGKLSAVLSVDRPETLDLLTRDSRALELALKDTGLDVGSGALNFSLRDQQAQTSRDGSFQARNRETEEATEAQNAHSTAEQIWLGAPKSLLDIRI